jgi:hypothetical protein
MTKFNNGDLVAAIKDIGGFALEFVPRGPEGVVVEAPLWEDAVVLFTVKGFLNDKKVRITISDDEVR